MSIKGFLPRFCAFSKFLVVAQRTGSSSTALAWQPWHSKSLSYSLLVGLSNLLEKEKKKIYCIVIKPLLAY